MAVRTISDCLHGPEKKLETNTDCKIYGDKGGLKSYHYEEMLKRLNEMDDKLRKVDGDREFIAVGLLLRKLWRKHEAELMVHTRSLYGGTHEQDIKSKKMKVKCFKFEKNEGVYGISIDLVYDTYQKDWSKAYQLAFHGFFTHIDYLSDGNDGEYYSYMHEYRTRSAFEKKRHPSDVIIEDVEKLLGDKAKLNSLHSLPKHDKGPLYDVIGKVLERNGRSNAEREPFMHGQGCWFDCGKSGLADFSKRLPMDVFAHMASAAVVNQPAFKALKDCLPNVYGMFIDILETMVFELCEHEAGRLKLVEVEKVESDKKGANPGEKVRYRVTKYNRSEVSQQDRNSVKWKIRISEYNEKDDDLDSYLPEKYGEEIEIEIDKKWLGKKITAMPYLDKPRKGVAARTVVGLYYIGTKQWGSLQEGFAAKGHKLTLEKMSDLEERGRERAEELSKMSEEEVKDVYENTYRVGVRHLLKDIDVQNKVINNFYKHGNKLSFDENSNLSKKLRSYRPFLEYYEKYLEVVKIMLREKTLKTIDGEEIIEIFKNRLKTPYRPNFSHMWDISSHDYYGLMGGTQTIKVDLEVQKFSDASYRVKTRMYIGDWYGADYDDINKFIKGSVPSLRAFFWLQHHHGCHPFETEIIFEKTDVINL